MAVAAVLGLLCVWLAYDLGTEIGDKRLGRAMALTMLAGLGLFLADMDSHYTALLGLVFALAFTIFAAALPAGWSSRPMPLARALMLGAVVISQPDMTIILALGYGPWLLTMWLGQPRPTPRRWLVMALGIPLLALIAICALAAGHSRAAWRGHFVALCCAASTICARCWLFTACGRCPSPMIGAVAGLRQRSQAAILAAGWMVLIVDFAVFGLTEALFRGLPLFRYDYPFSIAWHGPIIPSPSWAGLACCGCGISWPKSGWARCCTVTPMYWQGWR